MNDFLRLFLLVLLGGAGVTLLGSAAIWWMEEERRLQRALRHVLGAKPESLIIAPGRGRACGFSFTSGLAAVAWDSGAWCLVYRLDEVLGAELIVDGHVAGRAFRGEPRRALDVIATEAAEVRLRLLFEDPQHPDFDLDLWEEGDEARRPGASAAKAVQEANRWLARVEAILRRAERPRPGPIPVRPAAPVPPAPPAPAPKAAPAAAEPEAWEEEEEEEEAPTPAPPPGPPPAASPPPAPLSPAPPAAAPPTQAPAPAREVPPWEDDTDPDDRG